jgi:uncharacterized repeat protein (TIGR03803 family)
MDFLPPSTALGSFLPVGLVKRLRLCLIFSIVLLAGSRAPGGILFSNLFQFVPPAGGRSDAGVIQGADGNLYGTTYYGGAHGNPGFGAVYRLSLGGVFSNLFSFNSTNGANPYGGLTQGTNGNLFGATEEGGSNGFGTLFQMTTAGALVTQFSFSSNNGAYPEAALTIGADGNLYGTTSQGGTKGGFGTFFHLSQSGGFSNLFSFDYTNGSNPYGALVQGANGNFFGTTLSGGTNGGWGTIFEITPAGNLTVLHSFDDTNGASPYAGLVLAANGSFYGTTSAGGVSNNGTIFVITPAGSFSNLFSFSGLNGASPFGPLIQCVDGSFYGTTELGGTNTTNNYGTVFKWTPSGGLVTLVSFDYINFGGFPLDGLLQASDGTFYGTTHTGAADSGTVFRLSAPVLPFFRSASVHSGAMQLSWTSVSGQDYQLQFITNAIQTNWTNLGSVTLATNGTMNASDPVPLPPVQRFYRVSLLP